MQTQKKQHNIQNQTAWTHNSCPELIEMGVKGVPMLTQRLILGENEVTPSKKLLKHLPDFKAAIKTHTHTQTTTKTTPDQPPQRQVCYS